MENERSGYLDSHNALSITIQPEFKEVGEDQIRESVAITFELFCFFNVIQIAFSRWLGLDIADDVLLAIPNPKVRIAGFSLLWKGGGVNLFLANRGGIVPDEVFQGRVIALFSSVSM
jgi:hypothetical protein